MVEYSLSVVYDIIKYHLVYLHNYVAAQKVVLNITNFKALKHKVKIYIKILLHLYMCIVYIPVTQTTNKIMSFHTVAKSYLATYCYSVMVSG